MAEVVFAQPSGYTDITVVFDKSGSMEHLRESVVEGLNEFIAKTKANPGDARWTMVQFDDRSSANGADEEFPKIVFEGLPERDLEPMTLNDYVPRGGTALIDAVCKSINRVDLRTSGQENVTKAMMIITDGEENSSREFTTDTMREMIAKRQSDGWSFMYLAANQDAWVTASQLGFAGFQAGHHGYAGASASSGAVASGAVNSYNFAANAVGLRQAIASGMVGLCNFASGSVHRPMPQVNVSVDVQM